MQRFGMLDEAYPDAPMPSDAKNRLPRVLDIYRLKDK